MDMRNVIAATVLLAAMAAPAAAQIYNNSGKGGSPSIYVKPKSVTGQDQQNAPADPPARQDTTSTPQPTLFSKHDPKPAQIVRNDRPAQDTRTHEQRAMGQLDNNGSGYIEANEYLAMSLKGGLSRQDAIYEFRYLDKNRDGRLTFRELEGAPFSE